MSAHDLLNLLNELRKRDKMLGLPSILYLYRVLHQVECLGVLGTQL